MGKNSSKVTQGRAEFLNYTLSEVERENRKKKKAMQPQNPDTLTRLSIHKDMKQMLLEGKGKIEILTFLSNKYSDTNLVKYFDQWLDAHIQKEDYSVASTKSDKSKEIKDDSETR